MKIIDLSTWKRAELYHFFHSMDYPQYNICMNIDITNFLQQVKKRNLPFYYAMVYCASQAANEVEEFRYRIQNDQVIIHDKVHPSFTDMSPGSEVFKFVTVDLENTMEEFVMTAKRKADNQSSTFMPEEMRRDDLLYITCIPWISFTHISHTINLRKDDSVPRLSWGKYFEDGDKVLLPFSVQVNHALADGYHVGKYVETLQQCLDNY